MTEKSDKKKGSISEEDVSSLFQRYTATTVLTLLQEVAQFPDVKIDWNALVKNTSTGISNAREYQMLWRHLAYRDPLLEKFEDGAEPLDDDSDLEYELEASPAISSEASMEAAACVKVLIASGLPSDSNVPNSSIIEAPLVINIPNNQPPRNPVENSQPDYSRQVSNITVPVSVEKQPRPSVASEGLDINGKAGCSLPARKKRKQWSEAEDMELIAAVRKCGEGNWANILKGDFKGDRTASQLSQRWSIIRKRHGNLNLGTSNSNGSQLSEAQLAARRAVSIALNMSIGGANAGIASGYTVLPSATSEPLPVGSIVPQSQSQAKLASTSTSSRPGTLGSTSKSRAIIKKPSSKSAYSPDSMVKAAAVAAGARIATPDDAASLIKSANAVHIMGPGGSSLIKSSMPGGVNASSANNLGPHPNVLYIRTGLAVAPLPSNPATTPSVTQAGGNQHMHGHSLKHALPTGQPSLSCANTSTKMPPVQANAVTSSPIIEVSASEEVKITIDPKQQVQDDQSSYSGNAPNGQLQDQSALEKFEEIDTNRMIANEELKCSSDMDIDGNDNEICIGCTPVGSQNASSNKMMELPTKEDGDNQSEIKKCDYQSGNGEQKDNVPSIVTDRTSENVDVVSKEEAGNDQPGEN